MSIATTYPAYTAVDPLEWSTVQPHIDALLAVELRGENVDAWLLQWSKLVAVMEEASAQVYRDVTEDTADEAAELLAHHLRAAVGRSIVHHERFDVGMLKR